MESDNNKFHLAFQAPLTICLINYFKIEEKYNDGSGNSSI